MKSNTQTIENFNSLYFIVVSLESGGVFSLIKADSWNSVI
jgi:hypothetical protein